MREAESGDSTTFRRLAQPCTYQGLDETTLENLSGPRSAWPDLRSLSSLRRDAPSGDRLPYRPGINQRYSGGHEIVRVPGCNLHVLVQGNCGDLAVAHVVAYFIPVDFRRIIRTACTGLFHLFQIPVTEIGQDRKFGVPAGNVRLIQVPDTPA